MFKTNDSIVNLKLMARMVFPEATVIEIISGPKVEVWWRPRGMAIYKFAIIDVSDLTTAFKNAQIHPLTYFHVIKQRAEARKNNYD